MVSSRRARLRQRAESGDDGARRALDLSNDPNVFLATGQIGITLIGVLSGAFGGAALSRRVAGLLERIPGLESSSETIAFILVVLTITYLSLVVRRARSETDRAQQPGGHRRPDRGADAAAFPDRRTGRQSSRGFHGSHLARIARATERRTGGHRGRSRDSAETGHARRRLSPGRAGDDRAHLRSRRRPCFGADDAASRDRLDRHRINA